MEGSFSRFLRPDEVAKLGGASPQWYIQEMTRWGVFLELEIAFCSGTDYDPESEGILLKSKMSRVDTMNMPLGQSAPFGVHFCFSPCARKSRGNWRKHMPHYTTSGICHDEDCMTMLLYDLV